MTRPSDRSQPLCAPLPADPTPTGTRVVVKARGRYRGMPGTIVVINDERSERSGQLVHREYGVAFKPTSIGWYRGRERRLRQGADCTWFAPEELAILDS